MKIFIEKGLPKHLIYRLKEIYGDMCVVEKEQADIIVKYAHNSKMHLTPLEDYNTQSGNKKTLFFCWYDWYKPAHNVFFKSYFTPNATKLWDTSMCRFIQIPAKINLIENTLKELYDA